MKNRKNITQRILNNGEKAEFVKLARKNTVHFLCQSESDFFSKDEMSMYLTDKLSPYQNDLLFIEHIKDAIELRKQEFYKNRFRMCKKMY